MSPHAVPALLQALALMQAPRAPRPGPGERLPEGMDLLLRIMSGDEQAIALARSSTGRTHEAVREAAGFYIQQVMFASDSDSYRVLGLDADASEDRLKAHYRWLTRWLHPDRNRDDWEAVYAERVNRAWQDLRNGERRQRYDESRTALAGAAAAIPASDKVSRPLAPVSLETVDPGWNLRWLPRAIFGALGLVAILTVSVFYALQVAEAPKPEAQPAADLAPEFRSRAALASIEKPDSGPATAIAARPALPTVAEPATIEFESAAAADEAPMGAPLPPDPMAPPEIAPTAAVALRPSSQPAPRSPAPTRVEPVPRASAKPSPAPILAPPVAVAPVVVVPAPPRRNQAPATAPVPQAASQLGVDGRDANRLLGRFSEIYSQGDLIEMRGLFTADARSSRGGLGTILADYDRLFESSTRRSLAVRDVSWFTSGETLTIIASYQATVLSSRHRRPRRIHGDLRLDLRREDEQWRIYRMQHHERPG